MDYISTSNLLKERPSYEVFKVVTTNILNWIITLRFHIAFCHPNFSQVFLFEFVIFGVHGTE
jgi:hypothetical protein